MTTAVSISPATEIHQSLQRMQPEFGVTLPPQITPEKFVRVAMTAIKMQPDLLDADRTSLYGACMKAAQDGLVLDGREAALVTFNTKSKDGGWVKKVQFMPMLAGILKKIRQSGELKTIAAHVVRQKDKFTYYVDDSGEHFRHEPELDGDSGAIRLVYAVATTKDGGVYFDKMTVTEIDKIRKASRSGDRGPWVDWYDEMAKKSVLRRLAKRLPMSTDLPDDDDEIRPQFTQPAAPVEREAAPAAPAGPKRNSALQAVVDAADAEPVVIIDSEVEPQKGDVI